MRLQRMLAAAAAVPALSLGIGSSAALADSTPATVKTNASYQSSSQSSVAPSYYRYCYDRRGHRHLYWYGWGPPPRGHRYYGWWARHDRRWDRVRYCGDWRSGWHN